MSPPTQPCPLILALALSLALLLTLPSTPHSPPPPPPHNLPKWVLKHSARLGADYAVIVAPDEWGQGNVRIKDMGAGEQVDVPVGELAQWAEGKLA